MANEISYSDPITSALIQSLIKGNGSTTQATTTGGNISPDALAGLQDILSGMGGGGTVSAQGIPQVSAAITPEQLAAIFSQGAQQIPNLTAAFANAAGGRSANNSGLQLALTDLNEGLTRQAALLGQEQQKLSTDAAYKNSSMGLQAADINARMQMAAMNARAQLAAQMASMQRTPQVTNTVTDAKGGVDPSALMLGGMALNYANKPGGWLEKIFGSPKQSGDGVPVVNKDFWATPELSATPSSDYGFNVAWDLPSTNYTTDFLAPDFGNSWSTPDYSIANYGTDYGSDWGGNFDFGLDTSNFDFGDFGFGGDWGSSWDTPSYDFSNADYGSGDDWFSSDSWESFFADGGQPSRTRNRAYMGEQGTRMLTGVGNRDASKSPGLVAPVRFPAMRPMQMPQMQMPQQQQQLPRSAVPQQRLMERDRKELGERDTGTAPGPSFGPGDPSMMAAVKNILGANSLLSKFGAGVPGLGGVAGMANATSREGVLGNMALTTLGMVNPVAGLVGMLAKPLITRLMEENKPKPAPAAKEASAGKQQSGAVTSPVATPNVVGTPLAAMGDGLSPTDYGYRDPFTGNRTGGSWGSYGGDRGPGGSSGESGAAAGGANAAGPGGYADGGAPARGMMQGPGTGTSDSIPMPLAHVSNGEYIVSADVVDRMGVDFFDALQAAFHSGGKPA